MFQSDQEKKKSRDKGKNACGKRWDIEVDGKIERMNASQIAAMLGTHPGHTSKKLQSEDVNTFIKRIKKLKGIE